MEIIIEHLSAKLYIVLYEMTINVADYVPRQLAEELLKGSSKGVKSFLCEKGVTIRNTKVKARIAKKGDKKKIISDDENNDEEPFFIEILSEK